MLIPLYVISALVGGGLVALSMFGGDVDADVDVDVDVDADIDAHASGASTGDVNALAVGRRWNPLLSFKFWSFSVAFFGIMGLTLSFVTGIAAPIAAAIAALVGASSGAGASGLFHYLKHDEVDSSTSSEDFIGSEAVVLLPLARGAMGKVRITLGARQVDLLATSDDEAFARGDRVAVIEMSDGRARVVRADRLISRDA